MNRMSTTIEISGWTVKKTSSRKEQAYERFKSHDLFLCISYKEKKH